MYQHLNILQTAFLCLLLFMCMFIVLFPPGMESHGECEIKVQLNCSHCQMESCKQDKKTHLILCLCDDDEVLASDNITCVRTVGM